MSQVKPKENVTFMSLADFKAAIGVAKLDIVKNPNTGKLFMSANGKAWKCKAEIDLQSPLAILVPENGNLDEACLVNGSNDNVLGSI